MPSVVSTAPACIDALVAQMRAMVPQDGDGRVAVFDGGPIRDSEVTDDVIAIGYRPEDEDVVVDTRTREQMSAAPDDERYDILSVASSWRGRVTDQKTVRDRAYELVDLLAAQLAADQTLGGVVMRAYVSSTSLGQAQTTEGATATVRFTVSVRAMTR